MKDLDLVGTETEEEGLSDGFGFGWGWGGGRLTGRGRSLDSGRRMTGRAILP